MTFSLASSSLFIIRAAAERQAEMDRKAEEARIEEEASAQKQAEEDRIAAGAAAAELAAKQAEEAKYVLLFISVIELFINMLLLTGLLLPRKLKKLN